MWAFKLFIWLLFTFLLGPSIGLIVLVLVELIPLDPLRNKLMHQANLTRGDVLAAPKTEKIKDENEDDVMRVGTCTMQGWRRGMEDAHLLLLKLSGTHPEHRLFGVFDGHCGPDVAEWVGKHLPAHIESSAHFDDGDYSAAMTEGFISVDRELRRERVVGGSTGVVTLITPDDVLHCANVGDSRCVVSKNGEAVALSNDHKPTLTEEHDRIVKCGGFVAAGRVMGSLAMSRAFGDFTFKPQNKDPAAEMVTVVPEVISHPLTPDVEFMVVACDGIWDCCSNQEVVDYVHECLARPSPPSLSDICASLFDAIISPRPFGLGCDNMSMQLILFKHPQPPHSISSAPSTPVDADSVGSTDAGPANEEDEQ
eukprot:TRINITY_DN460_c1_g1_i1.p1 TRINITY_DN460_c1_g1~~TRINITY_DN460_c1_g1_i1.p1  ORF type:complete len:367 (+),score=71.63 TRINITY_DN460_c1_g1_i1:68-1168(+)